MNDDNFVPMVAFVVFVSVLMYMVGWALTEKRIYDNCLTNNSTMIHHEAVAKCRDIVK